MTMYVSNTPHFGKSAHNVGIGREAYDRIFKSTPATSPSVEVAPSMPAQTLKKVVIPEPEGDMFNFHAQLVGTGIQKRHVERRTTSLLGQVATLLGLKKTPTRANQLEARARAAEQVAVILKLRDDRETAARAAAKEKGLPLPKTTATLKQGYASTNFLLARGAVVEQQEKVRGKKYRKVG